MIRGSHFGQAAVAALLILCGAAHAQSIALFDGEGGATCEYFNAAALIRWQNRLGDWSDRTGAAQGAVPYAEVFVQLTNKSRPVEWDVSTLVAAAAAEPSATLGLLLRPVPGKRAGTTLFFSREEKDRTLRPALRVTFADGRFTDLWPTADTDLDCSTVTSLGAHGSLKTSSQTNVAMEFNLGGLAKSGKVTHARLQMVTTDRQYDGDSTVGVFRLSAPVISAGKPEMGLAAAYPRDAGIEKDPAVIMAEGFESAGWRLKWSELNESGTFAIVERDETLRFQPLSGKALGAYMPRGKNLGLDLRFNFKDKTGHEPEEIYFRYYLRLAEDWNPTLDGGKMPGISGTYGKSGWGGRKADGTTGWSLRGAFERIPGKDNPLRDFTTLGTYAYHADMQTDFGDAWLWTDGLRGLVKRNVWYSIEQYVRLNTPGKNDGVMRAWVDGALALEKTGIRMRNTPELKIETVWMNVYHGGEAVSPRDQHLFFDNVVIARRYIGPMAGR